MAMIVVATLLTTGIRWTGQSHAATLAPTPGKTSRSVTLLTGDRVTLGNRNRVEVDRAPGRAGTTFLTRWDHGSLQVVPADATPLLADGRLDPRLFDVSRLLSAGDDPQLVVGEKTETVRPEARAGFWNDLVGGRERNVRLAGAADPLGSTAGTVAVTVRLIGRDGQPATLNQGYLAGLDVSAGGSIFNAPGEITVQVPRGTYQLSGFLPTRAGDWAHGTMLVQPRLAVTGPTTVVLDARLGRPVSLGVPQPGAVAVSAGVGYSDTAADGSPAGGELIADHPDGLYTAQIGGAANASGFASEISAAFRASVDGDSPYAYHLAYYRRGAMWTGIRRHPTHAELATVRTTEAQTVAGSTGYASAYYSLAGVPWGMSWPQPGASGELPRTATEYFNADGGVLWQLNVNEVTGGTDNQVGLQSYSAPEQTYLPGKSYRTDWNRAPIGPGLPPRPKPQLWLIRTGDQILAMPSWLNDAAGHDGRGDPFATDFAITLNDDSRAGSDSQTFTVPAGKDRYRLEISADRRTPAELSTHVDTVWTFLSAHVDGDQPQPLPLKAIRFTPPVDDHNAATAGRDLAIPVVVTPQPGARTEPVTTLAVQVSYDDGRTWTDAPVRRTATGAIAVLHQPATPGFVSLRAVAADGSGNSVTQTIVRAYRLVAR
ncbi:hypothetical protein [Actinoplanes subtropicus]|uniref:hypothetical protein n=1 Tax=Actinoplanes subtropicus TaxID=543632 RepID=UPI0004C2DFBE|nr:hypothetical protein [Actinoplanes subtropicus]